MGTSLSDLSLRYRLSSLRYLPALLPACLALAGNLLGGIWAISDLVFPLVLLAGIDWLVPRDTTPSENTDAGLPDFILCLGVLFHTAAVFSLIYGISAHLLTGKWIWYAAASTGFSTGILGITAAHELIHRKQKYFQWLGIWNLFLANYTHFFIEHRLGHHFKVGTPEDPATARYGESLYAYLVRSIPGQWRGALQLEALRLRKTGKLPFGLQNFTVRAMVLQLLFMAGLWYGLGGEVAGAFLVQSLLGFFLLEFVNYIEHYGLVREKGEKVTAQHAWQSDSLSSRFTLFELSRHADHHMQAHKPYHTLDSHPQSPVLPGGYFGMFYIGLIPPLWFAMVHPVLEKAK